MTPKMSAVKECEKLLRGCKISEDKAMRSTQRAALALEKANAAAAEKRVEGF